MTRTRSVPQCWSAATTPTPTPVAQPTPRPTAPTPQPVAPTPRPTQVIPTNRPTNTPRPTLRPTPRPTVQTGGTVFQWQELTTYGECSASCGNGYETKNVECRRYDLSTCSINYNTANLGTCTEDNFSACDYDVVNNALCSTGCKPTPETRTCNEGACGNTCGDGILQVTEYCDPAIDTCCKTNCSGWKTNTNCAGTDPTVDAAVTDYDGRLFLFQGSNFAVYADMDSTAPLEGYPKPISTIAGLDDAFHNGVTAAASYYDDIVFLFRDLDFMVVDVGEMEAVGGVRDITDYFTFTTQYSDCGKIDAVLSYYWTMDFVCGDITAEVSWADRTMSASTLVSDKWDAGWPANLASGQLSAAVRDQTNGEIKFYQGSYTSTSTDAETGVVTKTPAFGLDAAQCVVDNCQQCRADMQRCTTCNAGYRRKRGGRLCKPPRNFVDMSFDDNDYSSALMEYTMGSHVASADNGGWEIMGEIVDGAFGYGLQLDGQSMTRLQPHDFGEPVDHWKVSFWWKPTELTRQRFLTLNRNRGNGYNEMFTIDFVHESDTEPIGANNLGIEVWMYDQRVDCYVDNPITVDEWNKISIEFNKGEIVTSANGVSHRVQMNTGDTDDYAVEFKDWYIGERSNHAQGVSGIIDKFEVANLNIGPDAGAVDSGSIPTWVLATLIGGTALGLGFVGFMFYRCYAKPKWCQPELQEELRDDGSDMPQAPSRENSSSEGNDVRQVRTGMIQTSGARAPPRPGLKKKTTPPRMPPRPASKAGKRPPPRGKKAGPPPPPIAASQEARGHRLDLGQTPEERRESWRI